MKKVKLRIESVAFKGYGVARVQGKVVFTPHTVTGDEAWIEVIEEKKRYAMGTLLQIIEPSPWRVTPLCPSFGVCGACQWQHIDYLTQGELKKEIFKNILRRLGGLMEIPPISFIPSRTPYGYRARIQLKVREKALGYFQEKSHQIVNIQECLIAHPIINRMLPSLRKMSSSFPQIKEIEINVFPDEGKGILILHSPSLEGGIENVSEEFLQNHPFIKGMVITTKRGINAYGDPTLNLTISMGQEENEKNIKLRISPGSFSQIHLEQNQILIQTVLQYSGGKKEGSILDLYAGVGNLTLPLAMEAKQVVGIEENGLAIEDARYNMKRNGIRNCDFVHGRVEDVLINMKKENLDCMVLDPPRTGCRRVLNQMVRLNPKKIVYVSCEPTTFARDLRLLTQRGYSLQRLSLIDMFPQTYHMEVVGLLMKPQG
jgi:23S rRNA (uracil1939-C5)-methyltransferase